jgi:hypothetical protein
VREYYFPSRHCESIVNTLRVKKPPPYEEMKKLTTVAKERNFDVSRHPAHSKIPTRGGESVLSLFDFL